MATLVKIKEVRLSVGLTENSAECYNLKKLLEDNNISYKLLTYFDDSQVPSVYQAYNTWNWGVEKTTKTFTDFPILVWTECYDDYEKYSCCITSSAEFNTSSLFLNKNLVEVES